MELTIREAATLLGRSQRTLRGQVARGDITARKRAGQWSIPSETLPLTGPQRRALQTRAAEIRAAVEDVLPSRTALTRGQRRRSLGDLDAFRVGADVLRALRASAPASGVAEGAAEGAAAAELQAGLLDLAEGVHEYDPAAKAAALRRARARLARAAAHLLAGAPAEPPDAIVAWVRTLEDTAIPAVSGLLRWAERLGGRPR